VCLCPPVCAPKGTTKRAHTLPAFFLLPSFGFWVVLIPPPPASSTIYLYIGVKKIFHFLGLAAVILAAPSLAFRFDRGASKTPSLAVCLPLDAVALLCTNR
jgi:hypothetical protein